MKKKEEEEYKLLKRNLVSKKSFFFDRTFLPSAKICRNEKYHLVEWKRPQEISPDWDPKLDFKRPSKLHVIQGANGNCWFLSALSALAESSDVFRRVVPEDNADVYTGIFHFWFWDMGKWTQIYVDDKLPTMKNRLIYAQAENNIFWPALVEKAYSKFYGSYHSLDGGEVLEAMIDFTGGINKRYRLKNPPVKLFSIIEKGLSSGALIGTGIVSDDSLSYSLSEKGLVNNHAYTIVDATIVEVHEENVRLLRIRNPWGNCFEWNGMFSDKSPVWKNIDNEARKRIGFTSKCDGEFFICYEDFTKHFDDIDICYLNPSSFAQENEQNQWYESTFDGEWMAGVKNPQVIINLEQDAETYESSVILSLTQGNRRSKLAEYVTVKIKLYALEPTVKIKFLDKFIQENSPVKIIDGQGLRQISEFFKIKPGRYAIVPEISRNESEIFNLRIFRKVSTTHEDQILLYN